MLNKMSMLLATAAVVLGAGAANADPYDHNSQNNDQYNANPAVSSDQNQATFTNGYNYGYDDGNAHRDRNDRYRPDAYRHEVRYERGAYYYGSDCGDNAAAGTVMGAVAGGVIGNQFGRGDGRAVATVSGVILGGLAGNAIAHDMNCGDRRLALSSYDEGFEGRIGTRYRWRSNDGSSYGSFTPIREYSRDGSTCRDFRDVGHGNGRDYNRSGTACRHNDGNWYLD
jgi:surface antigen